MSGGRNRKNKNYLNAISFGYVIIPTNVDRDNYIKTCFRTGRISVMLEGGVFLRDIYVTNECFDNIEFPSKSEEIGSAVVLGTNPYDGIPIVIGTFPRNDQSNMKAEENSYVFRKRVGDTTTTLTIDPINKQISLDVDSLSGGVVNVKSLGSKDSLVSVESSGTVEVKADENVKIKSYTNLEIDIVNPDKEKKDKEIRKIQADLDKLQITRSNENIEEIVTIDDKGIDLTIKDDINVNITQTELNVKTGGSTLKMNNDIIEFNGGGFDGMIKINELTSKLNELVQQVNSFISIYNTHQHTVQVAVPAGTGNTLVLTGTGTNCKTFNASDYKNEKITQG